MHRDGHVSWWPVASACGQFLMPIKNDCAQCVCVTTSSYNGTKCWLAVSLPSYCCANGTEPKSVQCRLTLVASLNGIACCSIKTPQIGVFMLPNSIRCSPSQSVLDGHQRQVAGDCHCHQLQTQFFVCSAWCSDKCALLRTKASQTLFLPRTRLA